MSVLWSVIKTYFHLLSFVDAVCSIQYNSPRFLQFLTTRYETIYLMSFQKNFQKSCPAKKATMKGNCTL